MAESEVDPEQETDRLKALLSDQWWRLNNLYYIKDKEGRKIKFRLNEAQRQLYAGMHYYNVILKARQLGFTTFIMIYFLDCCLFNRTHSAGVVAHTKDAATALFKDKVKFAYDNLPKWIRAYLGAKSDNARELEFSNGSRIYVGTSLRSGTFQKLLISEYGKTSAREPEKAKEIKTGALNTITTGQQIFIESTAEGQAGEYYDICQTAQAIQRSGAELTAMDPKFWFFPWYVDKTCCLSDKDAANTSLDQDLVKYFDNLFGLYNISLTPGQKAWYAKKKAQQGDEMLAEFPSTPDEAFRGTVRGAYFKREIEKAREQRRICRVPYESSRGVYTFWDLGDSDSACIWFFQHVGMEYRFIDYFEGSKIGGLPEISKVLQSRGYVYIAHYWPWDGGHSNVQTGTTAKVAGENLGIRPIRLVPKTKSVRVSIENVRPILNRAYFDSEKCELGLERLMNYREKWDSSNGTWSGVPKHDDASHTADALRTMADGYDGRRDEFIDTGSRQEYAETDYDILGA